VEADVGDEAGSVRLLTASLVFEVVDAPDEEAEVFAFVDEVSSLSPGNPESPTTLTAAALKVL